MPDSRGQMTTYIREERRHSARNYFPCTAVARGTDKQGKKVEAQGVLHNLSETGLYMRIPYCLEAGTAMELFIRFYSDPTSVRVGVHLQAKGVVLRAVPLADDSCDAAVKFEVPIPLS
jgi:hypothetical protein